MLNDHNNKRSSVVYIRIMWSSSGSFPKGKAVLEAILCECVCARVHMCVHAWRHEAFLECGKKIVRFLLNSKSMHVTMYVCTRVGQRLALAPQSLMIMHVTTKCFSVFKWHTVEYSNTIIVLTSSVWETFV
jgi:hypothetical protein